MLVGPDGSRRIQKDRLDDQTDDQARQAAPEAARAEHKMLNLALHPQAQSWVNRAAQVTDLGRTREWSAAAAGQAEWQADIPAVPAIFAFSLVAPWACCPPNAPKGMAQVGRPYRVATPPTTAWR